LSTDNRLTPALLTAIFALAASADHPELHSLFSGLPVAGYSGTLKDRYVDKATRGASGLLRAKTGSLTAVSALAGTVVDADGRTLAFALMVDQYPGFNEKPVHDAMDLIGTALVKCGCS
jgi:D-alanyl-D-alanine carboxypeptidase/D-alanyl-D-alanine-endopeptidase (penicillin-binding protein 4)